MKLAEAEKSQGENNDKYSKLLTELEAMANNLNEAENKARYVYLCTCTYMQFHEGKNTNYFFLEMTEFRTRKI